MDYSLAAFNWSLIAPEIVLAVFASVIFIWAARPFMYKWGVDIALVGLLTSLGFAISQWNFGGTGFYNMVLVDNFAAAFRILSIITSILAVMMSYRFLQVKGIDRPEFFGLMLIATLGMLVMVSSSDLIVMFLGLEIMSVPLYVLAGFARRSLASNEAGIKYFIMGAFASAFLLMGIACVFGATGSTDLKVVLSRALFMAMSATPENPSLLAYLIAGVALILVGFGFKIAAVPFHTWVPDVYQGAPTPITAFFSVGPKAAAFAVLLRIFTFGYTNIPVIAQAFWILAVLTMSIGNILALRQSNVKRMLAYSSIAHAGYILVAMTAGGPQAVSSALFYLVAYAMFNLGAFAILVLLETRTGCKSEFSELRGMAASHPWLAALLALFMFGLSGFPPLVGFFGKFYVFSAAVQNGFIWLTVIGVLNSFVSVYYYLRVVKACYFEKAEGYFPPVTVNPFMAIVLVITAVGTLAWGIFPQQLLDFSQQAIFALR